MSTQQSELPELASWQAALLRLTAFPVNPDEALGREWWEQMTGQAPETSTRKRLLRTDEGPIGDKVLALTVDAQRIDWSFVPSFDLLNPPVGIVTMGPFPDVFDSCAEFYRRFLVEHCPPIRRLALGAVLIQPSDSRESGYLRLDRYLPDVKLSPMSTDFNYRINRRRKSYAVPSGLEINRLSTWSVMYWVSQLHNVAPTGLQSGSHPTAEAYACRLELDVNTDPTFEGEFAKDSLLRIWDELVTLGKEVAAKGDIP